MNVWYVPPNKRNKSYSLFSNLLSKAKGVNIPWRTRLIVCHLTDRSSGFLLETLWSWDSALSSARTRSSTRVRRCSMMMTLPWWVISGCCVVVDLWNRIFTSFVVALVVINFWDVASGRRRRTSSSKWTKKLEMGLSFTYLVYGMGNLT